MVPGSVPIRMYPGSGTQPRNPSHVPGLRYSASGTRSLLSTLRYSAEVSTRGAQIRYPTPSLGCCRSMHAQVLSLRYPASATQLRYPGQVTSPGTQPQAPGRRRLASCTLAQVLSSGTQLRCNQLVYIASFADPGSSTQPQVCLRYLASGTQPPAPSSATQPVAASLRSPTQATS